MLIVVIRIGPCGAVTRDSSSWICTSCVGVCTWRLWMGVRVCAIWICARCGWMLPCLRSVIGHDDGELRKGLPWIDASRTNNSRDLSHLVGIERTGFTMPDTRLLRAYY